MTQIPPRQSLLSLLPPFPFEWRHRTDFATKEKQRGHGAALSSPKTKPELVMIFVSTAVEAAQILIALFVRCAVGVIHLHVILAAVAAVIDDDGLFFTRLNGVAAQQVVFQEFVPTCDTYSSEIAVDVSFLTLKCRSAPSPNAGDINATAATVANATTENFIFTPVATSPAMISATITELANFVTTARVMSRNFLNYNAPRP